MIHDNIQGTVRGENLLRVIPLQVLCATIPKVDGLPVRVVARPKRPAVRVEFVRKY